MLVSKSPMSPHLGYWTPQKSHVVSQTLLLFPAQARGSPRKACILSPRGLPRGLPSCPGLLWAFWHPWVTFQEEREPAGTWHASSPCRHMAGKCLRYTWKIYHMNPGHALARDMATNWVFYTLLGTQQHPKRRPKTDSCALSADRAGRRLKSPMSHMLRLHPACLYWVCNPRRGSEHPSTVLRFTMN